jgi:hypothetical protein
MKIGKRAMVLVLSLAMTSVGFAQPDDGPAAGRHSSNARKAEMPAGGGVDRPSRCLATLRPPRCKDRGF